MKAVNISKWLNSVDEITVTDNFPKPVPAADEALIRVHVAACNYPDILYSMGKHQNNAKLVVPPFILGLEFSGTIVELPPSVTKSRNPAFKVGDRVYGAGQGAFADFIAVKLATLRKMPDAWSFYDGAGFGATVATAYGALVERGRVQTGDIVLIHAAAGGLGLMAVQIAKCLGAVVIATASTDHKLEVAKSYGADHVINYTKVTDWHTKVLEITKGKGVQCVYDVVGLIDKSIKCCDFGARLVIIGFTGTSAPNFEAIKTNRILLKGLELHGWRHGESGRRMPWTHLQQWATLNVWLEQGKLRGIPFRDKEYVGLGSVASALRDLGDRKTWGKVCITLVPGDSKL